MIISESLSLYIRSLIPEAEEPLNSMEKDALADGVPIIRKDMQSFLRVLIETLRPENILEIGCAVGYSGCLMLLCGRSDSHLTTIENYEPRFAKAEANFAKAAASDRVTFLKDDAEKVLPLLDEQYDFIFMDGPKGQYINYFDDIMRILKPGGVLISDNVLDNGDIALSRFAVRRRDRTIHKRMREYLYTLTHDERLQSCVLPVGDGALMSVRKI